MTLDSLSVERSGIHVRVEQSDWLDAGKAAREVGFTYFSFLSGIDWMINPDLDGEKRYDPEHVPATTFETITDGEARLVHGDSRFSVFSALRNVDSGDQLVLYADLDDSLAVQSWTGIFPGADWHEREAWEMFGFSFDGHPGLRHIYLPEQFEGHPLRKDFMLAARVVRPWPGLVDMEEIPKAPEATE